MNRPKKISILDKESINELVAYLLRYKKLTISNLCVLELTENDAVEYYNVSSGKKQLTPEFRVNIKKARYLKEEIQRQIKKV